ncbi:MAG: hypothetical protein L6371_01910, partial [Candidatus Atribacteria bacterium]|nr:hypothetical protein [Candidatus Atribacteria bacterium]
LFLPYLLKYNFTLSSGDHNLKGLFLLGCVNRSFFLFTSYCPKIFFLSQREDVFNLPVKTQKKICSGRSFGNIKIFQPGN